MRKKVSHHNTNPEVVEKSVIPSVEKTNAKKEKKIKFQMFLKRLEDNIQLKERQKVYSDKIKNNTITFAWGPAGSSKSFTACYTLLKLLFEGKIEKIIFTKPIKESGENLGFLPGSVEDKLAPYVESFMYSCKEMIGDDFVDYLVEKKYIEVRPLAYMRGITFKNCGMFLDETQNALANQLMLYITRLGEGTKMIIAGDITQRDIERKHVVFHEIINLLKNLPDVAEHEFLKEDIVRHPLLIQITELYETWKEGKGL